MICAGCWNYQNLSYAKSVAKLRLGLCFVRTLLLLPANEVWGKVIFLHLFVIMFTGGWVPGWSGGGMPGAGGACSWWGGCLVPGGMPGGDPPDGYCCGRYASYWNAFLFDGCNWLLTESVLRPTNVKKHDPRLFRISASYYCKFNF